MLARSSAEGSATTKRPCFIRKSPTKGPTKNNFPFWAADPSRLAALLEAQISRYSSLLAPCQPDAPTRRLVRDFRNANYGVASSPEKGNLFLAAPLFNRQTRESGFVGIKFESHFRRNPQVRGRQPPNYQVIGPSQINYSHRLRV